jgi:hypothetical protein
MRDRRPEVNAELTPARLSWAGLSAWELACHASLTGALQVSRHLWLSGSARRVPVLTPLSGTQRARQRPAGSLTLATDILAVDGPTAVVRAEVRYGDPPRQEYRDLWVLRLAGDGRCDWFEEWPYWPGRPRSARDDLA